LEALKSPEVRSSDGRRRLWIGQNDGFGGNLGCRWRVLMMKDDEDPERQPDGGGGEKDRPEQR